MRQSHTAVVARNETWLGRFETEPWETAWASEAIFFMRQLHPDLWKIQMECQAEISPDGMVWQALSKHSYEFDIHEPLHFIQLTCFGGWLRLTGTVTENLGSSRSHDPHLYRFMAYLALKS